MLIVKVNEHLQPIPRRFSTGFIFERKKLQWPLTSILPILGKYEDTSMSKKGASSCLLEKQKISKSHSVSSSAIDGSFIVGNVDCQAEKARMKQLREQGIRLRRLESDTMAAKVESVLQRSRYGAQNILKKTDTQIARQGTMEVLSLEEDIRPMHDPKIAFNSTVTLKVRLHGVRSLSSNLTFVLLRHQCTTLQGILRADEEGVTRHMVRWAQRLPIESIIQVTGTLQKPVDPIRSASITDIEINITELFIINEANGSLPFNHNITMTNDEGIQFEKKQPLALRMANRTLDLRSPSCQAIFRIQSAVCRQFRNFLDDQGFMEIHTPKLIGGASESGASVFHVDYFGRKACLAQSPQLFKQMCICADFAKVYEIGPVFRAENSNTRRHLTEYTGLDLEMELTGDNYREVMLLIDSLLKSIFEALFSSVSPSSVHCFSQLVYKQYIRITIRRL